MLLQPRQVLYGHVARLWGSCFTPDESIVVSGSEDGTARFWDAGNGSCLRVLKVRMDYYYFLIFWGSGHFWSNIYLSNF